MKHLRIANRLLKPLGFKVLKLKCHNSPSPDLPLVEKWFIVDSSKNSIVDSSKNSVHIKYYGFDFNYYPANFPTTQSIVNFILKYIVAFNKKSKLMRISNPYFNKTLEEALVVSDLL